MDTTIRVAPSIKLAQQHLRGAHGQYQLIGFFRENWQEHPKFHGKIYGFLYSIRCFDFKGFKCMTRISFLAIFTAQIFENCFSFQEKKLQYQLYSEQGANQEDKGLANITNFQQRTQCSQCRIV